MTEEEWLACEDPTPMFAFLRKEAFVLIDRVPPELREELRRSLLAILTPRKYGLFACACCRVFLPILQDESSVKAIEVTERYLDGEADEDELNEVRWVVSTANRTLQPGEANRNLERARRAAKIAVVRAAFHDVEKTAEESVPALVWFSIAESPAAALTGQANILRDIFPFHPITLSPSWLTSTVVSLANQMYDTRDFSAMPILADALMDSGCDNEEILTHCRGPGPHVRGCWAIDLLTGRE